MSNKTYTVEYSCDEKRHNPYMGVECISLWAGTRAIFFFDRFNWVNIGDKVVLEKEEDTHFTNRVWINGELKTDDWHSDFIK